MASPVSSSARGRASTVAGLAVLGLALCTLPVLARADEPSELLGLSSDLRVRVHAGRSIELRVLAKEGDDYEEISRRATGSTSAAAAIRVWNDEAAVRPGHWIAVPLALLSDEYRGLVLRSLFPNDRPEGTDWVHVARAGRLPTYGEGLWQVAEWFTGRGQNFGLLLERNRLRTPELRSGQEIRIPADLLHPALAARPRSDDALLEYGSDEQGPYAGYRLAAGEALYSAVVVRFTGRNSADDVRRLAREISERSGIRDERDIPVGYLVKMPLDLLEPEFLPRGHPRRQEAEAARAEMARELARQPVEETRGGLAGVLVVLDPGHGGRDLGTINNGIWEHDYVYDVTCRLKRLLERESAATVAMTLRDLQTGCVPSGGDRLTANQQGTILTDPPFLARELGEASKMGVNLRWYLANSIYRRATANGTKPDRVVFLSIHADSRHRSLDGAMVYVPGARYRARTYSHNTRAYRKYREVREKPAVRFSHKERIRSEAVSRKLAESILAALRSHELPVQKHQPVRDRIIRGRSTFVPAVIRGNAIPAKVLVEMVNLGNPGDAALLSRAAQRETMARALFESLFHHFGEPPPPRSSLVLRQND